MKERNHISAALTNVDADNVRSRNQDSTFKSRFEACIAKYNTTVKINRATKNPALSDHMIDLFSILKEVFNHPRFRSTGKYVRVLMTKMEDAVAFVVAKKEDGKEPITLLRGEKRTSTQLNRKFMDGGGTIPRDECFYPCVYCKHSTVDEPWRMQIMLQA